MTNANHTRQAARKLVRAGSKPQTLPTWTVCKLGKVTFPGGCLSINTAGNLKTFIYDEIIDRENDVSSFPPDPSFPVSCPSDQPKSPTEWDSWLRKDLSGMSGPPPGGVPLCVAALTNLQTLGAGPQSVHRSWQPCERRQNQKRAEEKGAGLSLQGWESQISRE